MIFINSLFDINSSNLQLGIDVSTYLSLVSSLSKCAKLLSTLIDINDVKTQNVDGNVQNNWTLFVIRITTFIYDLLIDSQDSAYEAGTQL